MRLSVPTITMSHKKGPSVNASQPRGLQILMSNSNLSIPTDHHQEHHNQQHQHISTTITSSTPPLQSIMPSATSSISSLMDPQYPLLINTNTHSYILTEVPSYLNTIGRQQQQQQQQLASIEMIDDDQQQQFIQPDDAQFTVLPSIHHSLAAQQNHHVTSMTSYDQFMSRYTGGGAVYAGDMVPPFSPDIPEQYHQQSSYQGEDDEEMMPQTAFQIAMSPAPSSPSISSSGLVQTSSSMGSTVSRTTLKVSKTTSSASVATSNGEYRCDLCDKIFNKSCYLTQHNKTFHCGDKPFKCQRCGKRFPCDASHEEHVAKHGGDKPFKCGQCPKAFNHKTDLRRHMCLHSGSKPYSCIQCGKGFIRKDHMVKHMDTHKKKLNRNGMKKSKVSKKRLSSLTIAVVDSSDSMSMHYNMASE